MAPVRGPIIASRPLKGRSNRDLLEVTQPLTLAVSNAATTKDTAGSASGDSSASGTLAALANFSGSASGDSTASAGARADAFYPQPSPSETQRVTKKFPSRQREILDNQRPLTITVMRNADGAGSATGDSTASATASDLASFAGSATGDSTASAGAITNVFYPQPSPSETQRITKRFPSRQREVLEDQRPLTIAVMRNSDGAGSATGDSTASGTLSALASFSGSASGDATASAGTTANVFYPQPSFIELIQLKTFPQRVRDVFESRQPLTLAAPQPSFASGAGSAIGDSTASAGLTALADGAGSAAGDSVASGGLNAFADCAGSAQGESIASATIVDGTPPVVVTPVVSGATGVGAAAWRDHYARKRTLPKKKRTLLDELDDALAELRSRIEAQEPDFVEAPLSDWELQLRKAEAFAYGAAWEEVTVPAIQAQLAFVRDALREIDDEETLLLALA